MTGQNKGYAFLVTEEMDGRRADDVLRAVFGVSDRQIRALKRQKGILLDGKSVYANACVCKGQKLEMLCEDEYDQGIVPQEDPLEIVYEDEELLVLNKPAPLATLPMPGQKLNTLANRVAFYLGKDKFIFRPVNRLDKGTSGLMAVAKSTLMHKRLMDILHTPDFERGYAALCEGIIEQDRFTIDAPIGRMEGDSVRRCVCESGKPSVTRGQVIARFPQTNRTLVSLQLETGRTHQIRVHMAHIGHPVTGDYLYGSAHPALAERFALHSSSLALRHPFTGKKICFCSDLPEEIRALCVKK